MNSAAFDGASRGIRLALCVGVARPSRVLVVDAEPLCRWALREALSIDGFDVREMEDNPPFPRVDDVDVLVLDATLPAAGALRVLEHVRGSNPRCRVVLLTSFDEVGLARLAAKSPTWRAIQKPFDLPAVVAVVRDLSGGHADRRTA